MRLFPPTGFTVYKGATISSAFDATGALYWVCTTKYPDKRFGVAVFKQIGETVSHLAFELPVFCAGRGTISADGRVTAWSETDADAHTFVIPGFKPVPKGTTVPVSVPTPGIVSDPVAREQASMAYNYADKAFDKATDALHVGNTALDVANSKPSIDVVWQKALDAVDYTITLSEQDPNQHLARFTWQKALDAAYSLLLKYHLITA